MIRFRRLGNCWRDKLKVMNTLMLQQIDQMSIDERIQLAEALWDSIPAEADSLTAIQCEELDRRLADYYRDPNAGETWDVVKARILQ